MALVSLWKKGFQRVFSSTQSGLASPAANVCKCNVKEWFFTSSEWNNLLWTSSLVPTALTGNRSPPPLPLILFNSFSLLPIKKQTESQIDPTPLLSSAAIHILDRASLGKSLQLFIPHPQITHIHPHMPTIFISLSSTLLLLLLLLYKMRCPCLIAWANLQTHVAPFPPDLGIVPPRSLAKRRGIIFIPQTRGYAPVISNAFLAHCRGWFWPGAKPIILISLSLCFNSRRQCRFTARYIRLNKKKLQQKNRLLGPTSLKPTACVLVFIRV